MQTPLIVACAWCLAEQGAAMGEGSHTICEQHAAKVLKAYQKEKLTTYSAQLQAESCQAPVVSGHPYVERFKYQSKHI